MERFDPIRSGQLSMHIFQGCGQVKEYDHSDADGCCGQADEVNPSKTGPLPIGHPIPLPPGFHVHFWLYTLPVFGTLELNCRKIYDPIYSGRASYGSLLIACHHRKRYKLKDTCSKVASGFFPGFKHNTSLLGTPVE
jgi:hypothetical protein